MKEGLVRVLNFLAVDIDQWDTLSPKAVRQVRAREVSHGKVTCPVCSETLVIPLSFFTIKRNGHIVSDRVLRCASDSSAHAYRGGCGATIDVA